MDYDSYFDILEPDGLETYIVIAGIVGDDRNRYFSIFDEDGNTVIAPMQLPDDRGWKFYPNTDYTCELNGTWMCNDDLEIGSVVFGDAGSCIVDTDIEAFQTTYVIDKENHMLCNNGIEESIVCAYAVWGNYALFIRWNFFNKNELIYPLHKAIQNIPISSREGERRRKNVEKSI